MKSLLRGSGGRVVDTILRLYLLGCGEGHMCGCIMVFHMSSYIYDTGDAHWAVFAPFKLPVVAREVPHACPQDNVISGCGMGTEKYENETQVLARCGQFRRTTAYNNSCTFDGPDYTLHSAWCAHVVMKKTQPERTRGYREHDIVERGWDAKALEAES